MNLINVIKPLAGWAAWVILLGLLLTTVVPAGIRPVVVPWHYVEHILAFGTLGTVFAMAYRRQTVVLLLGLTSFTVLLEIAQLILPTRHARWQDLLVNLLAVCAGLAFGRLLQKAPAWRLSSADAFE